VPTVDVAIVGAGIVGLAHAYHLARQGRRVVVFERHPAARGASIRNFGMLWPIGQPAGARYRLARRSLEIWTDVLHHSGCWHEHSGSLHLAYHADEAQVLREFAADAGSERGCVLVDPADVSQRCAAVQPRGLQAGLWSPVETCIDPREVCAALPRWLERAHGVHFEFDCPVVGYEQPLLRTPRGDWRAERLIVCSGDELRLLYPEALAGAALLRCKLQMMRSETQDGWRLGPMLAAGLTLRHYQAFAHCPTLPALVRRFDAELPAHGRFGIHVLACQNGFGELVLGDSHEYGDDIEPWDRPHIDALVLDYLAGFLTVPNLRLAARWHGIYVKHSTEPYFLTCPAAGATIVTGLGGAGMTLSFGLAEQVVAQLE
jgi:FAD dependent oxidoreductase TIGR03364